MTRIRAAIVVVGAIAMATVVAFPPYMVVDRAAPATRHSGLAHHPSWSPPTPAAAEQVLSRKFGPPPANATSSLDIRWNSVLLTMEIALILLLASVAWIVSGRIARTRKKSRKVSSG